MWSLPRPKFRVILVLANFCILLLPVGGIVFLKIYESELIRQTEAALIGQAALLRSNYHKELVRLSDSSGKKIPAGQPLPTASPFFGDSRFIPIRPTLDMATTAILPPGAEATIPPREASGIHLDAGQNLQYLLKESQRITLCGIRLVDAGGVVVASSGSELGMSISDRIEVQRALDGYYASVLRKRVSDEKSPAYSSLSRRGWVRVLVSMPVIHDNRVVGAVLLSRSPLDVGKGLYFIRNHLITAGLAITFLVLLFTFLIDKLISKPLKELVAETKRVEQFGGVPNPPKRPGTREVAELSDSISSMAQKLHSRSNYIRDFANHVSHEFKTPLTSLNGAIELIQEMGTEMTGKEQDKFLGNMAGDVHRLERLTSGLLDLAKADMSANTVGGCHPASVLSSLKTFYADNDAVSVIFDHTEKVAAIDEDILHDILTNLVNNSLTHGQAGKVEVRLITPDRDDTVIIRIQDNGNGIPASDREKIFTPFFTTARNRGGTGLGLALCKSFLEAAGGSIELTDGDRGKCSFTLTLPGS